MKPRRISRARCVSGPISPKRLTSSSDLKFEQGKPVDARAQIDSYLASFDATPELLLLGVRVAHAQGDRLAAETIRTAAARRVSRLAADARIPELSRNPG